jgi:hypothetical protein
MRLSGYAAVALTLSAAALLPELGMLSHPARAAARRRHPGLRPGRKDGRDGTFSDVTEASGIGGKPPNTLSMVAAWLDYDNDGRLDLFVSN